MREDRSGPRESRVLFFSSVGAAGGGELCMLRLIAGLAKRGWQPILACPGQSPLEDAARQIGVQVVPVPAPARFDEAVVDDFLSSSGHRPNGFTRRMRTLINYARALPAAAQLLHVIRTANIDLVHSNSPRSAVMAGLAARLARRPAVTHVRDIFHTPFKFRLRRQILDTVSDVYVAASKATAEVMLTRRPVVVVYDGLETSVFERGAQRPASSPPEIGMVALMTPWKGHEVFIRAAKRLASTHPHLQFGIMGGHLGWDSLVAYRKHLEQMISALGMQDRIRLYGHTERALEWMSGLEVFVHPPIQPDPFPGVLLEACALGCPIVATRIGGIPEIVADFESAILVPPADDVALAHAIEMLLEDRALAQRLAAQAKRSVHRFTMDKTIAGVESAYREILA